MNAKRIIACLLAASALQSCAYDYEIRAEIVDGKLLFDADGGLFSTPDCLSDIEVTIEEGPSAETSDGDDTFYVSRGVYWKKSLVNSTCENPFPVEYGSRLRGEPFIYDDGRTISVEAKELVPGMVYRVTASGDGGYGGGRFQLSRTMTVTNLPR